MGHPIEIEPLVQVLLQIGERVVEVSREQVMTRIWDREGSPLTAMRDHYLGKKIDEIRNDSTIAACKTGIEEAFATGKDSYLEYVSYHNDNKKIVAYSLRILTCHPDKENYVFLIIENISKGRENVLVEDTWRLALEASEQGVWDANFESGNIFFSGTWEQMFGYSVHEITRISEWSDKVHPDDLKVALQKREDYINGLTPVYAAEIRYRCKDGTYKWILSRGIILSRNADGTPLRFIGTHTDISDRKQYEEELRQVKEMFANSFMYSGTGKALITPNGAWLDVNDKICELTELTKEELMQLSYRDITFPDDVDIDVDLIKKLINREIPSYTIEKRYVTRHRKVLTTITTVTLVWKGDQPKYFVIDVVDRTKKKELANELVRKNRELETTSANLMAKMKQIEELNHIVAHNLRGPAGNIRMLSEQSGLFSDTEALEMIHTSSEMLLDNLNIMVEAASIKLEKNTQFDDCNIRDIINNILAQLQGVIYQNDIRIELRLETERIHYPKVYLESILYNLVSNAIKYRSENKQPLIEISTRQGDGRTLLTVKDNGLGIDLEKYGHKIFQLNQTFHPGHDSKGVGLFITRAQIESLGGTITVNGKVGEGCEFVVVV